MLLSTTFRALTWRKAVGVGVAMLAAMSVMFALRASSAAAWAYTPCWFTNWHTYGNGDSWGGTKPSLNNYGQADPCKDVNIQVSGTASFQGYEVPGQDSVGIVYCSPGKLWQLTYAVPVGKPISIWDRGSNGENTQPVV